MLQSSHSQVGGSYVFTHVHTLRSSFLLLAILILKYLQGATNVVAIPGLLCFILPFAFIILHEVKELCSAFVNSCIIMNVNKN